MTSHQRRIAAAAYDLCRDERDGGGTVFVPVEMDAGIRVILGSVPRDLARVTEGAMDLLRAVWIAMLREEHRPWRAQVSRAHSALEEDLLSATRALEDRYAREQTVSMWLTERMRRCRLALAQRGDGAPALIVPQRSRASEPYPAALAEAVRDLQFTLGSLHYLAAHDHAALLNQACYSRIGAYRLGEIEADRAALDISERARQVRARMQICEPYESPSATRLRETASSEAPDANGGLLQTGG